MGDKATKLDAPMGVYLYSMRLSTFQRLAGNARSLQRTGYGPSAVNDPGDGRSQMKVQGQVFRLLVGVGFTTLLYDPFPTSAATAP